MGEANIWQPRKEIKVLGAVLNFRSLTLVLEDKTIVEGDAVLIKEHTIGNGGGTILDAVLATSVVIDPANGIFQSTGVPTLALVQRKTKSITVEIPTDFPDIQAAIDFYAASTTFAFDYVVIIIETGHLLTKGLELRHGDFSKFQITSEAGTVKLDPAFVGVAIPDPDYIPGLVVATAGKPLFYGVNCVMPELRCLIDMENNHGEGYLLVNGSGFILEASGVINAGERGLNARNSVIWAGLSNWSGANSTGVRAQLTSNVNVGGAIINNCCKTLEQSNGAVYVSRASTMELRFAEVKDSGGVGLTVRRSIVSAANVDFINSAQQAVKLESASKVDCIGSFAGGTSPNAVLYQCDGNSEMTCETVTVTTPNNFNRVFRIRSGGKMSMNNLTTIDGVEVTRDSVFQETGSPRFEFNTPNGYGVVFKENEPSSFDAQVDGVWTVNYLPAGRYTAHTTVSVVIATGTVASGAFSGQLTPPAIDGKMITVESYSVEIDGRTSAGGGGNRIFVNHCVGNFYTTNELKVQNTGQRLDGAAGSLAIEAIKVNAIVEGEWLTPALSRGKHDGADNAAVLTDTTQSWPTNSLIGRTLTNTTDSSSTTVTANTATTITGVLAGGADDDWDINDVYTIV